MIPRFDDSGFLPPGVHPANLDEIDALFGRGSELRRVQMQSVRWLVDLAKRAGVQRIVLNGSFVTDTMEPNDVDCVLLASESQIDVAVEDELLAGLPFLEILLVGPDEFNELVNRTFATDRHGRAKSMIEVIP